MTAPAPSDPPLVSVLLASRNGARYLRDALASIAAQTWSGFEVVAVDDGSTDETGEILREFAASRPAVRVIRTEGVGLAAALVRAVAASRGALLARHDDDDRSHPERLERQMRHLLAHPEVDVLGTAADLLGPGGERLGAYPIPFAPGDIRRVARRGSPFVHGSIMMRRDAYERAGGYRGAFRSSEDLDLWLRMRPEAFANLPERLYAWRVNPSGASYGARTKLLDFAALARTFAWERRVLGAETYALLEGARDLEAFIAAHPRPARVLLALGEAYVRDGCVGPGRAFLARALRAGGGRRLAALGWWLVSLPVALLPRARRHRRPASEGAAR